MNSLHHIALAVLGIEDWINDNPLIVGAFLFVFLAIFWFIYESGRDQIAEVAESFANEHGLQVDMPPQKFDQNPFKRTKTCKIKGDFRGTHITIVLGHDKQYVSLFNARTNKWYLEFRATLDGWPGNISLSPEGLTSKVAKWVGKGDFEIGHDEFDRTFLLKGPEEQLQRLLTSKAMAALLKFRSMGYDFIIDDGKLIVDGDPYSFEEPELRRTVNSMTQTARRVAREGVAY